MNQKAYSVLFCALVASTFVHELRAKGVAPVSSHLGVFERASSNEICELECHFPVGSNFNISFGLTVQVVENVLVVANLSANAALLVDASAQIVVVLNGTSGAAVAIDLSAKTGVYISSGVWISAQISISEYIKSSGGLKAIFNISGAVSFSFSSVSSAALVVINQIIAKLIINISAELQQNAQVGFQILVAIGGGLVVLLKGALSGILVIFGAGIIHISNDLAGFLNVLQGFASIVVKVAGSFSAVIEKGVEFDLSVIFGASSGLEVLIQVILQIGGAIDIGAGLGSLLNSAESFFKLIAQLGGNSSVGISGVFSVVASIVALINGNATLEIVISGIIQFVAYSSKYVEGDLTQVLNGTLSGFLAAVEHLNATSQLSGLVSIVKSLVAGSLIIGGVNISIIINKLLVGVISGSSSLLVVVAWVVLQLKAVVQIGLLIPYLVLILILKLNSAIGVLELLALGIQLEVSGSGSFLKSILSNAVSIILAFLTGQYYSVLTQLSGIKTIISALAAAISSASSGQYSLQALLTASSFVKSLIIGFFQYVSGIYLGISSSVIAQVQAIFEVSASASASIGVNITYSYSASISG